MKTLKIAVTGALGYSGKIITEKLLENGFEVISFTNSLHKPNIFKEKITLKPFHFDQPHVLFENLKDVDVLINTYWVRFNHTKFSHQEAVENTKILMSQATKAGVKKIIHTSITNPNVSSKLEYFKGKGKLEEYLKNLSVQYSILRPSVFFGMNDILINNMAWMIRNLPIMGVFGDGSYQLQPIHIDDFADLIIKEIHSTNSNEINANGPETFTYKELISLIMKTLNINKPIYNTPPFIGYCIGKMISWLKNDVTITREEIKGLMQNYLYIDDIPKGKIKLSVWLEENKNSIGKIYANELERRKK